MNDAQYKAAKATMPWTEQSIQRGPRQVIIQVIDNKGCEVPLYTMTAFLTKITRAIAAKEMTNAEG